MVSHPNRSKKNPTKSSGPVITEETVISVKGFNQDFSCRGFKFEVGKTYEHAGNVEICASGFHACEHPLDVLQYYNPATSRFALVTQSGSLARHTDDTKVASAKITIDAEIQLPQLIERAVKWVFDRAKWVDGPVATGANEAATASGDSGAATASGYSGAATASGDRGAATASGDRGAATASGNSGAATASGNRGKARGADGCALFLVHRDDNWNITHAWAGIVGRDGIKPMTWYMLDANGKPVEVND